MKYLIVNLSMYDLLAALPPPLISTPSTSRHLDGDRLA